MAGEIAGVGASLRRWSGTAWVALANITSVGGPAMTKETHDTTSIDTIGGFRTFIGGLKDGGTLPVGANFSRAAYDLIKTDFESSTLQNYELVLPDADTTSFEFTGLVTELTTDVAPDALVTMNFSIQISGQVVINSGSGS